MEIFLEITMLILYNIMHQSAPNRFVRGKFCHHTCKHNCAFLMFVHVHQRRLATYTNLNFIIGSSIINIMAMQPWTTR